METKEEHILDGEVFKELREIVYQWTGIYLSEKKSYFLKSRLQKRLEETDLPDLLTYIRYLKKYSDVNERQKFIDAVTTKETTFFRESEHFEVMVKLIKERGLIYPSVLSIGCSTGEEPYTVAIFFKENSIVGKIYAVDISHIAIEAAQEARYSDYSLRTVPSYIIKKYFSINGHEYRLKDDLKSMVSFYTGNVMESKDMKRFKGMDFILCRNLFIYFDDYSRGRALANIYEILNPRGILFLGFSETGYKLNNFFKPLKINGILVYEKL